jgi:hypothetical protein
MRDRVVRLMNPRGFDGPDEVHIRTIAHREPRRTRALRTIRTARPEDDRPAAR